MGCERMRNLQRFAISTLMILVGGAVIWFLGWFLWCQFEGWAFIKNTTFQHLLLLLISAWIVGALVKAKPRGSPSENPTELAVQEVQCQHNSSESMADLQALRDNEPYSEALASHPTSRYYGSVHSQRSFAPSDYAV